MARFPDVVIKDVAERGRVDEDLVIDIAELIPEELVREKEIPSPLRDLRCRRCIGPIRKVFWCLLARGKGRVLEGTQGERPALY